MKKAVIVLDFDHTVFNTTLYVNALQKKMQEDFGISEDKFTEVRNKIKDCCVVIDIDKFVDELPYENKQALHEAHHQVIKEFASGFVFDDVEEFINNHLTHFDITLLTHGDKELQTEKINHSNLPDGVEHIISTDSKDKIIKPLIERYDKVYFVDDKASNVDDVKTAFPEVVTYLVVRAEDKPYGDVKSKCDCADFTVEGLKFIIRSDF